MVHLFVGVVLFLLSVVQLGIALKE